MTSFGRVIEQTLYTVCRPVKGILEFAPEITTISKGRTLFIIDTGFSDYISLPQQQIASLKARLIGEEKFVLADERIIVRPVYLGIARFGRIIEKVSIIHGKELIGMGFINKFFKKLKFDMLEQFIYVTLKR